MLGFIGTGNMASAIISGAVSSKFMTGENIAVYNRTEEKAKALSERYGVKVLSSADAIAQNCSCIVLSVKPAQIAGVLSEIKATCSALKPLIISIAAGKTLEFLSNSLEAGARIIRVMPNLNAVVGESISAVCANDLCNESDIDFAFKLCSSFGRAVKIDESQFSIFSAIGGCSPAFAFMFVDSLARAAVKHGMPKNVALEVSAQAVLGSAKTILETQNHPWELIDRVCSPGGTTIEGVLALEKDAFQSSVCDAVDAAYNKDKSL